MDPDNEHAVEAWKEAADQERRGQARDATAVADAAATASGMIPTWLTIQADWRKANHA